MICRLGEGGNDGRSVGQAEKDDCCIAPARCLGRCVEKKCHSGVYHAPSYVVSRTAAVRMTARLKAQSTYPAVDEAVAELNV